MLPLHWFTKLEFFECSECFLENFKPTLIRLMGSFTQPAKFGCPGASHKHATGVGNFKNSTKNGGNKTCTRKTSKFGATEKETRKSDFIYC